MAVLQSIWVYRHTYSINNEMFFEITGLHPVDEWYESGILEGWMGCETYSPYNQMFFIALPLLAVIPYGISLYNEWKSGYAGQVITRCGRKKYLCSKFMAVFISGGLVAVVPLGLSLIISACYIPAIGIDPLSMQAVVANNDMWAFLYFEYPVVYAICYICVDFIYGGIFACITLTVSKWFTNRFGAIIFPLLFYCSLYYGISNLFPKLNVYNFSIYMNPAQIEGTNRFSVLVWIMFSIITGLIVVYAFSNKRRDSIGG